MKTLHENRQHLPLGSFYREAWFWCLRDKIKVLTGQCVMGQYIWSYEILLAINMVHFALSFPKDWII